MRRPIDDYEEKFDDKKKPKDGKIALSVHAHRVSNVGNNIRNATIDDTIQKMYYSPPVVKAFENICFIAELLKKKDRDDKIDEDWKYVAMVLDRLFLLIFSIACFVGTVIILLRVRSLEYSENLICKTFRHQHCMTHDNPSICSIVQPIYLLIQLVSEV